MRDSLCCLWKDAAQASLLLEKGDALFALHLHECTHMVLCGGWGFLVSRLEMTWRITLRCWANLS